MTRALTSYDRYRSDFRAFQKGLPANSPAWLREIRAQGMASFDLVGFPTATRGNEKWKYTNVSPIAGATFQYPFEVESNGVRPAAIRALAPWHESWTRLAFVNGAYSPALSTPPPTGLRAANLAEVIQGNGDVIGSHLSRHATVEDDGFTAINTAFLRDGAVVHVPEGSAPEAVLHLLFVTTKRPQPVVTYPRTLIVAGPNSRLTVIESYVGLSQGEYFTNSVAEIVAEEGARIEHYRYLAESPDAFHIGTTRVYLSRDSAFNTVSFARGARLARNDLQVLLDGPGASCQVNGLYLTSGTEHIDNHIDIDHARPHTSSDQYFKGVLADRSRAIFSGRVLIRKDAQKTFARQADKNLILSDGARVHTKPSLEIFADDVQATHGATAGAIAEDALFYMMSRGLDEQTARNLLIHGFASEIVETVRVEPLRAHLDQVLSGALPDFHAKAAA